MFSGLNWTFPISEMSGFVNSNMQLIMPLLLLILGVMLALLLIDGITGSLLKIIAFVVGVPTSPIDLDDSFNLGGNSKKKYSRKKSTAIEQDDDDDGESD
jgi:hypothetical protein